MADNFQVPSTLPDGDPGVNIHALERTVNAATVKVGVSVTVDPTDPTKRQAVDSTYGAAVDVTRSALPALAATSTAQATGNASLASIDGKLPAQGQALAAASVPVVLTAAQVSTLTPPAAITGFSTAANQTTIIGHVDGIEGLLTTIDADTSTLAAVDYATGSDVASLAVTGGGVEASALRVTIANDSTGVVSVDDNGGSLTVDGTVTANAGSGTFAISAASLPLPTGAATAANQPALGQAAMASSLPVTMASDQTPIPVGASMTSASASFTRPADTTAYGIGDVVCNSTSSPTVMTFASVARANGGSGRIVGASLVLGSNPTTKPTYDLMLFDTAPAIDNDNALFTPTDAEMLKCVARIPFAVPTVGDATGTGTNCVYFASVLEPYICDPAAAALYGVLVARNAVTPSSADTYNVRLIVERN